MPNVDPIFQQINEGHDIKKIRAAIIDLIEYSLHELKNSLGYWEKACFADALNDLKKNINSNHQPATADWLRSCLVSIENAYVPPNQRDENYTPRNQCFEALTYEQFVECINTLRCRIDR